MHFLGLAGMPRRIPDYPDAYAYLNYICSLGSVLTGFSVLVFLLVIYFTFCSEFYSIKVKGKGKAFVINMIAVLGDHPKRPGNVI
jgi:heme/copper-type cytochrome/quinol oxidase subunit 1